MSPTAPKTQPAKTRILLVDDNRDALQSMSAALESLEEEILTAANADEALRHLLRCEPAVIVLDVMMPDVNGFELAGIIRQRDKFRHTPIIFLTGMGREDRHILQGYEAGAVDYLLKPCDPDVLRYKVKVFVDLAKKNEQLRANAAQLEQALAFAIKAKTELEREMDERRRAEQSRDRLAGQLGAMPDFVAAMAEGAVTLDRDGVILYSNRRFGELVERDCPELAGLPVAACIAPDSLAAFQALLAEGADGRATGEIELQCRSGARVAAQVALSAFRSADIEAVAVVVTDLRDQRRNEAILAEGRLARLILEHSHSGMVVCDVHGRITLASSAIQQMCGENPALKPFDSVLRLQLSSDTVPQIFSIQHVLNGATHRSTEVELRRADGSLLPLILNAVPIHGEREGPLGCVVTLLDISERKAIENALRRSEKLAAAGRIAGALAHEVNNPLNAIANLLFLLESNASLDESARHFLRLASSELERVAHIVRRTLAFYRDTSTAVSISLKDLLHEVVEILSPGVQSKNVTIHRRFECEGRVVAFPGEVRQMVSNILANAIEAAPPEGEITLHLRPGREHVSQRRQGVQIVIADRGPGIAREHRSKLFEPFFTTKEDRGTGLGLWVAQGIVQKHGGTLRVRTSTDAARHGTVFSIFLPYRVAAAASVARAGGEGSPESAAA